MIKAIIYVRFSTVEQREGASKDRQVERCTTLCETRGWDIERIIVDEGRSAFHGRHRDAGAGFGEFEAQVRAGVHTGKVLVIERLSRLSRQNPHFSYDLMRMLVDNGVTLAIWDGTKIYRSLESIDFMETIEFFLKTKIANEESAVKADFGRDKWERRRRDAVLGKVATKNGPPWLRLSDDRNWIVLEDRASLIRRMFDEADAGDGALRIAKRLNEERVAPWPRYANRTPTAWDRKFVGRILTNPAVIGDWHMNRQGDDGKAVAVAEPVRGYYPRIVEPDLFARVTATAGDRLAVKGGRRSSVVSNLVSGLAVCAVCGGKMEYVRSRAAGTVIVRSGKPQAPLKQDTAHLYCRSAQRGAGCANRSGVAYVGFERALLDAALHHALDDDSFVRTDEVGRLSILIADRQRDLEGAVGQAKALWNAYTKSQSDMAMSMALEAEGRAKAISAAIADLQADKERASGVTSSAEHLTRLGEVRRHLYADDLELRRAHRLKVAAGLRSVIEKIECRESRDALVTFVDGLRVIRIVPGRGRRAAEVWDFDLHHPDRKLSSSDPRAARYIERKTRRAAGG